MPTVSNEKLRKLEGFVKGMLDERNVWWPHWRELAQFILPRRYSSLMNERQYGGYAPNNHSSGSRTVPYKNDRIIDPTGTQAARVLASGLLNGITSPSRPWYRLKQAGDMRKASLASRAFFEERRSRGLFVLAQSNFYTAMVNVFFELAVFGNAVMLVYEDKQNVINCVPIPIGEYAWAEDERGRIDTLCREFSWTIKKIVERWGLDNCSDEVSRIYKDAMAVNGNSARLLETRSISHLITTEDGKVIEYYWETGKKDGRCLERRTFRENPIIAFRWDVTPNDAYATGPGIYALPDVKQLQQQNLRKAQGLDKMVSPPVVADIRLAHKPTALMPGGITFANMNSASGANSGIRAAYQIQIPIGELREDIKEVQMRVEEFFHNDLFRMISQLNTVRSATEIDALVSERLTLLAPVLERAEQHDGLGRFIDRLDGIMQRGGLFDDMQIPPELEGAEVDVQFISVLADAQTAVAAGPIERFAGFVGNIAAAIPQVLQKVDWDQAVEQYGNALQISGGIIRDQEAVEDDREAEAQQQQLAQSAQLGSQLAPAAKLLSETDQNAGALGALLG